MKHQEATGSLPRFGPEARVASVHGLGHSVKSLQGSHKRRIHRGIQGVHLYLRTAVLPVLTLTPALKSSLLRGERAWTWESVQHVTAQLNERIALAR